MGFIEKAKTFLQTKSAKVQAFYDREEELRTKMTDLEAKKSKIINEYDPIKPFDPKELEKLDKEMVAAEKEIAVLTVNKAKIGEYDIEELIKYVAAAKTEANDMIAKMVKMEEYAREKILAAKKEFLEAQAEHFRIVLDAKNFPVETSWILAGLIGPIQDEINRLRDEFRRVDLEIYQNTTSVMGNRSNQAQLDILAEEKEKIGREINRLQAYVGQVNVPIPLLNNYRDGNGKTIYFIHEDEQLNAANKGIILKTGGNE